MNDPRSGATIDACWSTLGAIEPQSLTRLFGDDPARLDRLSLTHAGLYFDFSKTHLNPALLAGFGALAEATGLAAAKERLFGGEIVNPSEQRAATHVAERGTGMPDDVAHAQACHARMRALIDVIEAGGLGDVRHILHIGIGGSALGPAMALEAFGRQAGRYEVAVVSNVDGQALADACARFDPHATLIVVASKTFTTLETLLNTRSALAWLNEHGVDDPYGRLIALTATPERAIEFGIDETRILPFAETVGGRYSLWSAVGFPVALALGWDRFEQLLEGAAAIDRHFRYEPAERNVCLIAAFCDLYYATVRKAETRAVFAYDERLRLLTPYLQQLEMESNGKQVSAQGMDLTRPSAPITWGGTGTDAQHAVFQLLHQGTHLVPVEFVAVEDPGHALDPEHQRQLLASCIAQGAALMAGRSYERALELADGDVELAHAKTFPGDRPSTTILLEQLDPATLGALIAFYEHRVFANAVMLGVNPFDQWGVELGKEIARSIGNALDRDLDGGDGTSDFDPSTRALIERAFG